jgi:hypothetical protein
MRRTLQVALLVTALPFVGTVDAQTPPREARPRAEAQQERRAELEQQVRQQFLAQVAERLELDASQRDQLEQVLRAGAESRRELAQESRQVRMAIMQAVRRDAPAAAYEELLQRMAELRARELRLEQREDAALAQFLDARQRATFLVLRMQLSERVRGMRATRGGDRPRGPGG